MMPVPTLEKLVRLANDGANVIFKANLPADVPGFGNLQRQRNALHEIEAKLKWAERRIYWTYPLPPRRLGEAVARFSEIGNGRLIACDSLEPSLGECGIPGESLVHDGLRFARRKLDDGYLYFLANRSGEPLDKCITLETPIGSAVIFDPRFESRVGKAWLSMGEDPLQGRVLLQLQPSESVIVRTFTNKRIDGPDWVYVTNSGPAQKIIGTWKVEFIEGEPNISKSIEITKLGSWTSFDLPELKSFAGSGRYTIAFDRPEAKSDDWMLDLGKVCESARVKLNGHQLGALWCAPFRETVGEWLKPGKNTLEVEVTNLAANRIADLDRRKVKWKYFYDINVASKRYRSLDASDWPLFDSGLLGPVTLTPLKKTAVN
jgi:hypothetical protein